jgi:selenocysteine lyase/cysteine desulfurase
MVTIINRNIDLTRRYFLGGLTSAAALAISGTVNARAVTEQLPVPPVSLTPSELARNEAFWREVATYYDRTVGIVNLEHGYWGKMAQPVKKAYIAATNMVNAQNSFYARKEFSQDLEVVTARVAAELGAHEDEIVITRNATEAIHNLIRQYRGLKPGDSVLLSDIDYPGFKPTMRWLEQSRGVSAIEVKLPNRATQGQVRDLYVQAFEKNPGLKLMLITHVSNQHGLVIPVAEIAAEARRRGIDVICDAAQSWGLIDYRIGDLGIDWAGFNLHKWIGAPLGVGALYMRRGTLQKIAPYPGEMDAEHSDAAVRVHSGTTNFAAKIAIPSALDFHQAIGSANKEARLRYLRSLWTDEAEQMSHIEVLGGADEASWSGIGSFRLQGQSSQPEAEQLQLRMEKEFGIFTVVRKGLNDGSCVRVTPQVFNSADEIGRLVDALRKVG